MKEKNEKGITLIALVVTIIILLILAGITLNTVLVDGGIISKAGEAGKRYENSRLEEQNTLNKIADKLNEINQNNGGNGEGSDSGNDDDEPETTITCEISFRQSWSGGGNDEVTYSITPQANYTDGTLTFSNGKTTGTLSGNATGKITFNGKAGTYVYEIKCVNEDVANYSYDRSIYQIIVNTNDSTGRIITIQNSSNQEVEDIVYRYSYSAPSDSGDGGGDDGGN